VLLTLFGSIHVNVAWFAVDTLMDFGDLDIRVIALNVLPGTAYLAVDSIAVILIEPTHTFYLLLIEVVLLRRG
jgi:hypothetical protein